MRILQVINNLQIGGAEVLLKNMAPLMQQSGLDVTVCALHRNGSRLEEEITAQGVPLFFLGKQSVYSGAHVMNMVRHLANHKYDIVHVHLFPAQLWAAMAISISGQKTTMVTTEHNTYNRRRKMIFRPMDKWMYTKYKAVACVSEATETSLLEWMPHLHGKTTPVPNGVYHDDIINSVGYSKKEIIGRSECPIILFVGRFDNQKDHRTLLKAVARIPEVYLLLAGEGPTRPNMENLARDLGIASRVHFLGNRSDIPKLIKTADIYVQSSYWEGYGLAALEAMTGGLPVIGSRVPGLTDVIGTAGLTFESENVTELCDKIVLLLNNEGLRKGIGDNCQKQAMRYAVNYTVEKYIGFYKSLNTDDPTPANIFSDHSKNKA